LGTFVTNNSYSVTATVYDSTGDHQTADTTNDEFTYDTTAPTTTITNAAYDTASDTLTLTGTNFNTIAADGDDVLSQLDWSQIVWDIDNDGATSGELTISADDVVSATVTSDTELSIVFQDINTNAVPDFVDNASFDGTFDPLDTDDTVQITDGFTADEAGNVAGGDGYDGPTHTQSNIVVFDLVGGNSSSHSERNFSATEEYTIYVLLDSDSRTMHTSGSDWGKWSGGSNLGGDDTVVIVGDTGPIDIWPRRDAGALQTDAKTNTHSTWGFSYITDWYWSSTYRYGSERIIMRDTGDVDPN